MENTTKAEYVLLAMQQSRKSVIKEPESKALSSTDLEWSRNIRLHEDLFEKYWTKPIKKHGSWVEDPNNPPTDTMAKLWPCKITIGPHVFDVVMYAVRNPAPQRLPMQHRPVIQYGPVKSLNEVIAERAERDQEFRALLERIVRGNASAHDIKKFEDYVKMLKGE